MTEGPQSKWFIDNGHQISGPFTLRELRTLLDQRKVEGTWNAYNKESPEKGTPIFDLLKTHADPAYSLLETLQRSRARQLAHRDQEGSSQNAIPLSSQSSTVSQLWTQTSWTAKLISLGGIAFALGVFHSFFGEKEKSATEVSTQIRPSHPNTSLAKREEPSQDETPFFGAPASISSHPSHSRIQQVEREKEQESARQRELERERERDEREAELRLQQDERADRFLASDQGQWENNGDVNANPPPPDNPPEQPPNQNYQDPNTDPNTPPLFQNPDQNRDLPEGS